MGPNSGDAIHNCRVAGLLAEVAALRNVMRQTRNHHSC
jgi:hypothetical protein